MPMRQNSALAQPRAHGKIVAAHIRSYEGADR
jgi:hypothetical protein